MKGRETPKLIYKKESFIMTIYTNEERILIEGATALERLNKALQLDLMLLELEKSVGLMDGLPLPSL